jgi:hypothetical protein
VSTAYAEATPAVRAVKRAALPGEYCALCETGGEFLAGEVVFAFLDARGRLVTTLHITCPPKGWKLLLGGRK